MERQKPEGDRKVPEGALSGLRAMVQIHADARRADRGALIVLHTPWGGGSEALVKEWRRHVLTEREHLFEGSARPDGSTYRPLREIVSKYVRALDDLGLLDDQTAVLAGSVSDALGLTLGERRAEAPERGGQLAFFERVGELLVRLGARLRASLIVHDFHRADSASRAALLHVFANVVTDPVAHLAPHGAGTETFSSTVVVTTSEVDGAMELLRRELSDRPNVHFVSLEEAEREQIRKFLVSEPVIRQLMRASAGSVDQLREMLETLPERAEDAYLTRLTERTPAERQVLETLALLRRAVKPDFLLRLADVGADAPSFASLADARLIVRQVNRGELLVDFPSPEHRDVLYRNLPAERRRTLHGRIAVMLEERSRLGEAIDLEVIAHHYLASDDDAKAMQYALDAADRLHISYAYQRAAEILRELLPRAQAQAMRAEVLDRLADVHGHLHELDAAIRALEELAPLVEGLRRVEVYTRQARLLLETGAFDRARQGVEAAERLLESVELTSAERELRRDELAVISAEVAYGLGDYDRAMQVAREALARESTPAPELLTRVRLRNTQGKVALFRGNYGEASELFGENQRASHEAGLQSEEVRALFNLGTIALQQRRYEDAERIFHQSLNFGEATASPVTRSFLQLNLGVVYHRTLRYGESLRAYLCSLAMFRRSGNDLQYAVTALNLGSLYETLGDLERAAVALTTSLEVTRRRDIRYFQGRALFVQGLVELGRGRPDAARASLVESLERLGSEAGAFSARVQVALARAAHASGRPSLRDEHLERARTDEDTPDGAQARAEVELYGGYYAALDGRVEEGARRMERALLTFEEQGAHESIWLARLFLAELHTMGGQTARALGYARSASDLIEHIAMQVPEALRDGYLEAGDRRRVRALVERLEGSGASAEAEPDAGAAPADAEAFAAWRARYASIVGEDERLIHILQLLDRVSQSDSTVLIQGESGTGKELIAEAIHQQSGRSKGPFIKVNCAAFVESLLLSELFGHERGAFTGAMSRRKGRFELADGGTLFLDEIGDISANTQVALLRVLQERSFERVGGTETIRVDVRLTCATNRNLDEMVREGTFRLDLYYRLKGVVLELPPLRERRADIPRLIERFIEAGHRDGAPRRRVARDAMDWLVRYSWPGNVRELENFVRSLLLFVDGDEIQLRHVLQFEDFFADGQREDTPPFVPVASPARLDPTTPESDARAPGTAEAAAPPRRRSPRTLLDVDPVEVPQEPAAARVPQETPAQASAPVAPPDAGADDPEAAVAAWALRDGVGLPELKRRLEVEMIRRALEASEGNISQAARLLEMKRSRLSQIVHATPELESVLGRLLEE